MFDLKTIKITPLLETLHLEKISDAIYFSSKYSGYVSNSRLGLLNPRQDGSPEKFFEGFKEGGFNTSLQLGSAVHELILQPESFELADEIDKPSAKLGAMADALYPVHMEHGVVTLDDFIKASNKIEYYKDKVTSRLYDEAIKQCAPYWNQRRIMEMNLENDKEQIFLDHKTRETVISCVQSLKNDQAVMDLLHPKGIIEDPLSENEQAVLLDVQIDCPNGKSFIVKLKSKVDNYTIDAESNTLVVNDVKTIGRYVSEIDNNIARYHYSREMAMYLYLMRLCAMRFYNMDNPHIHANYLVVSTVPNFYTKVRSVTYHELVCGFKEFQTLLKYVGYLIGYKDYSLDEPAGRYKL